MTRPARCGRARGQGRKERGDALLEALIGILLTAAIGLGLSYAAARTLNAQRYVATQSIALAQMRNSLQTNGIQSLCSGTATANVTVGDQTFQLAQPTCTRASITVTVTSDTTLNATLASTSSSVVTGMALATPSDSTSAASLLGSGAITVSQ